MILALAAGAPGLAASTAFAGGPVIVEEDTEVVAEKSASSAGLLPLRLIPVILCAALCGGDDDTQAPVPIDPKK
jgi:hypothetical protein